MLLRATDETLRLVLVLDDGSTLRITERWQKGSLFRYSYYWLNHGNQLIIGWDNAPHHHDLGGFPDHKHIASTGETIPSTEKTLDDVVSFIEHTIKSE